ncbi:MAG: hypothetical protein J5494_04510 [Candidatus Methanomethylophilaceae archaeon]|nr:hypothetical protein [Candidatus Methanomethylophilaceae archaeon]
MELEMCVPCLFGLEGLAADELRRLDMKQVQTENGRERRTVSVGITNGLDAQITEGLSEGEIVYVKE